MTEEQIRWIVREEVEQAMHAVNAGVAGVISRHIERSLPLLLQDARKRSL